MSLLIPSSTSSSDHFDNETQTYFNIYTLPPSVIAKQIPRPKTPMRNYADIKFNPPKQDDSILMYSQNSHSFDPSINSSLRESGPTVPRSATPPKPILKLI